MHQRRSFNAFRISLPLTALMFAWSLDSHLAMGQSTQGWLGSSFGGIRMVARDSAPMVRLVQPLCQTVKDSVVQVFSGQRVVALGTVIAEDGYVLTKFSELSGDVIKVRMPNGEKIGARVTAVRRPNDLAVLKLDSSQSDQWDIKPIQLNMEEPPKGSFLISAGRDGYTVGLGILGVHARKVTHDGRLGVRFFNSPTGPATVREVHSPSGAARAGLQERDQIIKINGKELLGSQSAIKMLRTMYPGDVVHLTIKRGDDTKELDAMMNDVTVMQESQNDTRVNGPRNVRLRGFDQVIQHDTVLSPSQCGGPVLDLSGNVIGINIARAGRVVSYCLPSSLVAAEIVSMLDESRQ